ncbi:hypothetical protein D6825_02450, partial [Candidatus Woesearchaeota archaeon]
MSKGSFSGKEGQITVFMIIGLLVLIAFGVTIYAVSRIRTAQYESVQEGMDVKVIQDHISTCLNIASEEAFLVAGSQGGMIFADQGGVHNNEYPSVLVEGVRVPLLIRAPEGNVGSLFFSTPPNYPFEGFPYSNGKVILKGYYGESRIPPLYKTGPDGVNVSGSIEESLERFIEKRVSDCVDFSPFSEKGIVVSKASARADIVFAKEREQFEGERFVSVHLRWPLGVTFPDGRRAVLEDFSMRMPVRLASMYYTVKQIIDADVTDIGYVPSAPGFIVQKEDAQDYSLLRIVNPESKVANDVWSFVFARENRLPALWKIDTRELEGVVFHLTREGRGAKLSVSDGRLLISDPCPEAGVPDPFPLFLNASDPDEDPVHFEVDKNEIPRSALE